MKPLLFATTCIEGITSKKISQKEEDMYIMIKTDHTWYVKEQSVGVDNIHCKLTIDSDN